MNRFFRTGLLALTISLTAHAGVVSDVQVDDNTLSADIDLTGGFHADLSLSFENVTGLTSSNVGLSAQYVSPTDTAILARLPNSSAVSIPTSLPLLIKIQPPASGGLSFEGLATIELYTQNLSYTGIETPFRLFSASDGGDFKDITASVSAGSYRVRGGKGEFSEFLILGDTRSLDTVIGDKFERLQDILDSNANDIDAGTLSDLEDALDQAVDQYANANAAGAMQSVDTFVEIIGNASAEEIPNVWRSARDLVNVAGQLRAAAATLRFSLAIASNQS